MFGKAKEQQPKLEPLISTKTFKSLQDIKSGDTLANAIGKLYALMKEHIDADKEQEEIDSLFAEDIENDKKRQHEEILKAILGINRKKKNEKVIQPKKSEEPKKVEQPKAEVKKPTAEKVEKPPTPKTEPTTPKSKAEIVPQKPAAPKPSAEPAVPKAPSSTPSTMVRAVAGTAIVAGGTLGLASSVIAKEEGLPKKGKAYWDPPGQNNLVSVGYGHQIKPEEYSQGFIQAGDERVSILGNRGIDTVMTPTQAQKVLQADLPKYEKRAKDPLGSSWNKLNDNQKSALISYAYNTGSTVSLVKQGLVEAIESGDMQKASAIIKNKGIRTAGGIENKTLVERRAKEASLFLKDANTSEVPANQTTGQQLGSATVENKELKKGSSGETTIVNNTTNIVAQGGKKETLVASKVNDKPIALQGL